MSRPTNRSRYYEAHVNACQAIVDAQVFDDVVPEIDPYYSAVPQPTVAMHIESYALGMYRAFETAARAAKSPTHGQGVKNGFWLVGTGIGRCYDSYVAQLSSDRTFDGDELHKALLSAKTLRFFVEISRKHADNNRVFELHFGLRDHPVGDIDDGFSYDAAGGFFVPKSQYLTEAKEDTRDWKDSTTRGCPAARFIPHIWRTVVNGCHANGLFTAPATSIKTESRVD